MLVGPSPDQGERRTRIRRAPHTNGLVRCPASSGRRGHATGTLCRMTLPTRRPTPASVTLCPPHRASPRACTRNISTCHASAGRQACCPHTARVASAGSVCARRAAHACRASPPCPPLCPLRAPASGGILASKAHSTALQAWLREAALGAKVTRAFGLHLKRGAIPQVLRRKSVAAPADRPLPTRPHMPRR